MSFLLLDQYNKKDLIIDYYFKEICSHTNFTLNYLNKKNCFSIHGLNLNINTHENKFNWATDDYYLDNKFKVSFDNKVQKNINWLSLEFLNIDEEKWSESSDWECYEYFIANDLKMVVQRDFVALFEKSGQIWLFCSYKFRDGFFNFLRWLLPQNIFFNHQILLHSSAIIDSNKLAHICLGASGAGKSTIASFAKNKIVLGDDMNFLTIQDGKVFVTAAAVGQIEDNKRYIGELYQVAGFYKLNKDKTDSIKPISKQEGFRILMSAFANLNWNFYSQSDYEKILKIGTDVLSAVDFFELSFNLEGKVWEYVEQYRCENMEQKHKLCLANI